MPISLTPKPVAHIYTHVDSENPEKFSEPVCVGSTTGIGDKRVQIRVNYNDNHQTLAHHSWAIGT